MKVLRIKLQNLKFKLLLEGIIIGILTGLVISFFRFIVDKSSQNLKFIYNVLYKNLWLIPIWLVILVILGFLIGLLIKKIPVISGSGIPQVEGAILGKTKMNYLEIIIGKFIGSIVSIASGLSLGIEGPSVQIGAAVGKGFFKAAKINKNEENYLITSGISAGISAAFNAPLAGVMFSLEEINKSVSPFLLISALSSALSSDFISRKIFGLKPIFNFEKIPILPLNYYIYIILLGIIIGIAGIYFNKALLFIQSIYSSIRLKNELKIIIPFSLTIIIGFIMPMALGSGNIIIESLSKSDFTLKFLIALLIIKFIFTMISAGSGAPGGIFIPLFSIAAIIGCIYGRFLVNVFHINSIYIGAFIIYAMAGYFAAIVKSPITGSILVIEMTGSFARLLPVTIVAVIAYITADLLNGKPIYNSLLTRYLKNSSNLKVLNQ